MTGESDDLWADFLALCDCGGREAGSASEARALELTEARLRAIGGDVRVERVPYAAWRLREAQLTLLDGTRLPVHVLLGSESTSDAGITLETIDLGCGTLEDFDRQAAAIPGKCVIVRHEYPFRTQTIHRRRKLGWAMERGAAGFVIAAPERGMGPVAGSSGRGGGEGIPAVGTDFEAGVRLAAAGRVYLKVLAEDYAGTSSVLILDLPGQTRTWVALSAHLDGHSVGESAMDNATGLATILALARELAPRMASFRRGLRVCVFSAEEWALAGSRSYLDRMPESERHAIRMNVNLDTVAGDNVLTALTSEFPALDEWVQRVAARERIAVATYQPMMANSDHYNFARHGIPAFRLVAGFDRAESNVRHILTRGDTRDKIDRADLDNAARVARALVVAALSADDAEIDALARI